MSMNGGAFSRSASAVVSGLVDIGAQTFAGAKTFAAAIIASAGVQLASLWNTNGTGASDIGVKIGVSTADGSVNVGAKLVSVRSGLNGGTEVERAWFKKSGTDGFQLGASAGYLSIDSSVGLHLNWNNVSALTADSNGLTLTGTRFSLGGYLSRGSAALGLYAAGTSGISETIRAVSQRGDSGLKCVVVGTESASPNAAAVLFQVAKSISVTNHADAGNGTAVGLQVMGDGNIKALNTVQLNTDGNARPAADASNRGKLWYSKSAGGAADTVEICLKSAADTYSWVTIGTG